MTSYLEDVTFATAIARGWGLAVRCKACLEQRRLSDKTLLERFNDRLNDEVVSILPRLKCTIEVAGAPCGGRVATAYFYQSGTVELPTHEIGDGIDAREQALKRRA